MKKFLARVGSMTKGAPGAVLIAVLCSGLVIFFSLSPAHDRLEYVLYDLRCKLKAKPEPLPELVLLNIDDASVSALGVFPWPRHYYAYAMRQMQEVGLASLVFDTQFIDDSPPLLNPDGFNLLLSALAEGQEIAPEDLFSVIIDNDKDLAMATADFPGTIMPFSFAKVENKQSLSKEELALKLEAIARFTGKASLPLPAGNEERFRALADADRLTINYPIPSLMNAADYFGFVDNDKDLDGVHRKVRLVRVFGDRIYLHLSLVSFLRMCGVGMDAIDIEPGKSIVIHDAVNPATGRRGDITIPVDSSCAMYFDWIGDFGQSARSVSAHALIEYAASASEFEMQLMLKDMVSGRSDRQDLSIQLDELKAAILAESNLEKRFVLRSAYRDVLSRYNVVIDGYLGEVQDELDQVLQLKASGYDVGSVNIQSFYDLIKAIEIKTTVDSLFDSIAVMGLTAAGTQDQGVTPLSSEYWMVGSYPTAINTMARGRFIRQAPPLWEYAAMVALALGLSLFIHKRSAKLSYAVIALVVIAVNGAIFLLFFKAYIWVDQVSFNLALILPSALIMVSKFAGEEEHRQFIQGAFSKYLSQDVIDQIIENPEALKLGGESCNITTFFSDVAGFSTISEKLSAEGLVHLLNEYLSEMTDIIMDNKGTVDKYEGDAIMAFWGAPLSFPDHPYLACLSTVAMQRRLSELRQSWKSEDRHELRVRMGINSGPAVAGNMGSRTRMNYTVMGDSVNLASRLEGANKVYGTYSMVSGSTRAAVGDRFQFRELDTIRVVGKNEPIVVHELLEEPGKVPDSVESLLVHYDEGLVLYKARRWKDAAIRFVKALKIDMEDGPSKVYYRRCMAFMKAPPPESWDGVYNMSSK